MTIGIRLRKRRRIRTRSYDLYTCDNLPVLRGIDSNSVNLIYLNPPRNTGENMWGPELDFTHFKRRKRGSPQVGGTERPGVPAYRGRRPTVKNPPTPATGDAAPGRWRPRRSATACRTRPRCAGSWGGGPARRVRPVVREKSPSRTGVVRAMARSDHWRWVSTPRCVRTS